MYVGIDIGGTTGRVAAFDSLTSPTVARREDIGMKRRYEPDLEALIEAIRAVLDGHRCQGIGIGIAGAVDPSGSTITGSGNLTGWLHHPVTEDLTAAFKAPVKLANDAYVAALSEAAYGKLAGHNFWFMIWGTGVGGSFVESGGSRPTVIPTELGHQMLDWHAKGKRCGCGQAGCLESFAGGAKIKRNRGKAAENLTEREWSEVCDRVSQGLYNLMTIRPVSAIVIGGGIAVKQAQRLSDIEARLARRLRIVPSPTVSLVTHQEEAGLIGALGLLK